MVGNNATKELVRLRTGREDIRELIRELYVDRRWTDQEIADYLRVDRVTVNKWRRQFAINRADRQPVLPGEAA